MPTQQCPRCGSGVPEGKTECNICFAPLGPAAQAPPPPTGVPEPAAGIPGLPLSQPSATTPSYLAAAPPAATPSYVAATPPAAAEPVPGIPGLPLNPPAATPNYLTPGAQPGAGGGMGSGEVRMSLTGEVLEVAAPTPRGTGPGGYGPPVGTRPGAPPAVPAPARAGARPTPAMPARRERAPARSGSGGAVLAVVLVLLLAGGGAGGWWWYQKQHGPAAAAEKTMAAMKNKDWKTFFEMVDWPQAALDKMGAQGGKDKVEQQFVSLMSTLGNMVTFKDYKIGDVTNNGDTATVKVTMTVEAGGMFAAMGGGPKTSTQDVPFRRVNGEWKVDGNQFQSAGMGMGGFGGNMGGGGANRGR